MWLEPVPEETLGSSGIPPGLKKDIDYRTVLIYCTPEILDYPG
jgi:hypothetical protein